MEKTVKNRQLNSIKKIRLYFNKLINDFDNDLIEADKFKTLCYSLNIYNKIFENSEIEARIEALEKNMNVEYNPNDRLNNEI